MMPSDRDSSGDRIRRHRHIDDRLPAALEGPGRDEQLVHGDEVQASGARADHRHSVPGTMIPGGPRPAASYGEWERIQAAARPASSKERSGQGD
jgi:hypothetical protein